MNSGTSSAQQLVACSGFVATVQEIVLFPIAYEKAITLSQQWFKLQLRDDATSTSGLYETFQCESCYRAETNE